MTRCQGTKQVLFWAPRLMAVLFILFLGLGLFYIFWAWGRFPVITYVVISGLLFLLAILFGIGWIYRDEIRGSPETP